MSEPLLKALIKLFAIVAKEDEVTKTEREQIEAFLLDHLSDKAIPGYLQEFDEYSKKLLSESNDDELKNIDELCKHVNLELTQKQKIVIILELTGIILADGEISKREDELLYYIGRSFNVPKDEINKIKSFVVGESQGDLSNDHILIVDAYDQHPEDHQYYHFTRNNLDGFIAILHLSSSESFFIRYLGNTDLYLNGVPLKQRKILVFAVGSTLRGEKVEPIYYGDVISRFKQSGNESRITFIAENISFQFKNGTLGLRNISIIEESGGLIGLMGASGAGKSTLLNVLNGSEAPTEGTVKINGIDIHKEASKVEGVIGFVPQDDLLIEDLTVYQNLFYAAKLCFDNLGNEEIEKLVSTTLNNLGLSETRNLKVGSPLQKTISGGQRKRLNIGLELLREPSVLFVDEPTSGLSSRDSENIMDLLKELSLKGKLVFVVIHQPSSEIFKMFDKLVILDTGGYQIYYGNPVEAVVYFRDRINLINSDHGECAECGNVNPEQIFNIIETRVIDEYGNFTGERKISPEQWNKYFREKSTVPSVVTSEEKPPVSLSIPSKLRQIKIFSIRDILSKLSNKQYLMINLIEAPLLAFLLAYIVRFYNDHDNAVHGYAFIHNINIPAYLFMSIIVALFMGLTVSAEEIIRDRKILKRESFLNLSRMSYLQSKIMILFTLSAIQTLSFVLIGNAILEIEGMFWQHWFILFSTSCMANILGLNISSSFNSAVTIYILIPILLIPQLILSGVVVRFDKLNPTISTTGKVPVVGDMMASRWAFEAAMVSQFKDNPYESMFYEYDKTMADSDYKRIYFIPTLNTKLADCINHYTENNPETRERLKDDLELLRIEISKELKIVGSQHFPTIDKLNIDDFSPEVYKQTSDFLDALKNFYSSRYKNASSKKDSILNNLTNSPEKRDSFREFKDRYYNEAIASLVKNQSEQERIIEEGNELFQKIYPIYMIPHPNNWFDFRTQFYVPKKHFAGKYFDTFNFNLSMIWIMSFILMVTLYFDVLRKIIEGIEKIGKYR